MEITIISEDCISIQQELIKGCLPLREPCTFPASGFIVECGEQWNCQEHCPTDSNYQVKHISGDIITLQFNFFNNNDSNRKRPSSLPTDWIQFEICDSEGGVSDLVAGQITSQMSAFGCGKSYQVIEFDTTELPSCFYVRATVISTLGEAEPTRLCSEWFEAMDEECPLEHLRLESNIEGVDCNGVCFGLPEAYHGDLINFQYNYRVEGYIKSTAASLVYEDFGFNRRTVIEKNFRLRVGAKLPQFMYDVIVCQTAYNGKMVVDGEEYLVRSQTPSNKLEKGFMWLFDFELYQECKQGDEC